MISISKALKALATNKSNNIVVKTYNMPSVTTLKGEAFGVTVDAAWSGYTILGIMHVYFNNSGASYFNIYSWMVTSGEKVTLSCRNDGSQDRTTSGTIKVLYIKNDVGNTN